MILLAALGIFTLAGALCHVLFDVLADPSVIKWHKLS